MDSDRHRRVKTVLLIVIGFLLLILGMVIGLLLGSVINDHSPGSGKESSGAVVHILDDVNNKMNMLNAPVELVSGIFSKGGMKSGLFGVLGFLTSFLRRKK